MKQPWIPAALILLCLAGRTEACMTSGESPDPGAQKPSVGAKGPVKPLDLSGAMSGIRQPRQVVARDAKAFAALWKEHAPQAAGQVPQVDFAKYDVVAVFAGSRTTGGYQVLLGDIKRAGRTATVAATLLKPGRGTMVTQAFTSPFALRAVPKLPPTVRFVVTEKER